MVTKFLAIFMHLRNSGGQSNSLKPAEQLQRAPPPEPQGSGTPRLSRPRGAAPASPSYTRVC